MTLSPRLGVLFKPGTPIGLLAHWAHEVERLGFDELWLAEDCFRYGGMAAAATSLALTSQIQVGIGLLPAAGRNAVIAAMEMASLAELYPHRFQAAIGHGVEGWMRQIGARPRDRVIVLEEVMQAIGQLLRGETVTTQGEFVELDDAALLEPPAAVPKLLIGSTGERGIALAASLADGLVLPEGSDESAITAASRALHGRGDLVVYAWMRIDEDAKRAVEVLRPTLEAWRRKALYTGLLSRWGVGPDESIDATVARRVAVAGTAQDCAAVLARFGRAGATTVVLIPVGEEPSVQLERFAEEVRPLVLAESFS
jgi:5,10-methylenetetrahydromethanopterin reductase